jgi:XTP/dITP diphosphohydrolase
MLRFKSPEIQSDDLEKVACRSAFDTFKKCHLPLIVEDAGLFVEGMNGFPGPYAAYVHGTIGNKGLLKLMEDKNNRRAKFRSVMAYHSQDLEEPACFSGEVEGKITREERRRTNQSGFGFDPIFQPNACSKTFAEMTIHEKNKISHRAKALRKFAQWYAKRIIT